MRIIIAFLLLSLLPGAHPCLAQEKPAAVSNQQQEMEGYQLVWADEFDKDGSPDSSSWRFEQGLVRNQELQWYQRENAFCRNGYLIIEGRRETTSNPGYIAGSNDWRKKNPLIEYSASSINTKGTHAWKYGRFVMRGKIDISSGLWPAWRSGLLCYQPIRLRRFTMCAT